MLIIIILCYLLIGFLTFLLMCKFDKILNLDVKNNLEIVFIITILFWVFSLVIIIAAICENFAVNKKYLKCLNKIYNYFNKE
jgi:hypothetical protein